MTDEEHSVVGRYRLFRRIGAGAMGVVWEGHDERLNRPVAVKKLLLQPGLAPDKAAEAVARSMREGRIAARLHHPNAIAVFDVVDEDDVPCLVMEYLPSRSLATVIADEGLLTPERAADVGTQVASALVAAHAAGIVHRDITPGNILLGDDGAVKITDFGISRATDDATVTNAGGFAGTPAYLAPEVALGGDPTSASDVFSLGSTLYTAIEGESPFGRAANTLGLLHAVAGGKINPPQRSGALTDVLVALLAADPQERPTAAEARDLLAGVGQDKVPAHMLLPVVETTPTVLVAASTEQAPTQASVEAVPAPRSHRPLAAAGVFVVALIAVGLWLLGSHDDMKPAEERSPAVETGHNETGPAPVTEAVAPVKGGQHTRTARTPVPSTGESSTAPANSETSPSLVPTTTTQATTTENAAEPTTDTSTPPPTESEETAPEPTAVD